MYISTCVFIHFHPFSARTCFYQNISSLQKKTVSSAPLNATPVLRYWKMHCCHHPRARRLGHWDLHAWRFLRDNDEDFSGKPNGRNGIFPRFQKEIHFQAFWRGTNLDRIIPKWMVQWLVTMVFVSLLGIMTHRFGVILSTYHLGWSSKYHGIMKGQWWLIISF